MNWSVSLIKEAPLMVNSREPLTGSNGALGLAGTTLAPVAASSLASATGFLSGVKVTLN